MTLELEIDVPESRTVTLTLPPDTPIGKARVSVAVGPPPTPTPFVPHPAFVHGLEAFNRMLPELLKTHRGQFVAVFQGGVVGAGPNKLAVAHDAYEKYGAVNVLVRFVAEEQPIRRITGPRLVHGDGA